MSEKANILVVDDNPSMNRTLVDILSFNGYRVRTAYSGLEALEILDAHSVDILLTDLRMPDMSGVELFKRTQKTHPDLVVILMTAYAADEIIQHELNEGILAIVTKPLDIDRLLTLFSTAMRPDHR